MRYIATILFLYFVALFTVPCSDAANSCEDIKLLSAQESAHDHDKDSDDNCSPFCQCTCCSISINTFLFTSYELNIPSQAFPVKEGVTREISFTSNYLDTIWQPPKFNT